VRPWSPSLSVAILAAVTLARRKKLRQVFRTVEHASSDAKEPDASGFAGAKEGDASDA